MKIVRTGQMEWADALAQGAYKNRRKALGGEKLSCGLWELAPGKKSFPLHSHHVTDEALYALSGRAVVRTTEGETEIGPGDFVSFPPGGPAHQLVNRTQEPFVYLAMSVSQGVDIVEYPDTDKVASSFGQGADRKRYIFNKALQVEYFAGDKDASG